MRHSPGTMKPHLCLFLACVCMVTLQASPSAPLAAWATLARSGIEQEALPLGAEALIVPLPARHNAVGGDAAAQV